MIFEKVKETIVNSLGCDEANIVPEAKLAEDLRIDSLDAVELVMALEEEFGISIPDEELSSMLTVGDVVDCINKYRA